MQLSKNCPKQERPPVKCAVLKDCVSRSGMYKALKCLKETGLTLPKVQNTPNCKVRMPKLIKNTWEKSEEIQEIPSKSKGNWLQRLE